MWTRFIEKTTDFSLQTTAIFFFVVFRHFVFFFEKHVKEICVEKCVDAMYTGNVVSPKVSYLDTFLTKVSYLDTFTGKVSK